MNDQPRDDSARDGQPSWPTGDDPDAARQPPPKQPPSSPPDAGQPTRRQPRRPAGNQPIRPAGNPANQPTRAVGMPPPGGRRGPGGPSGPPAGRPPNPAERATDHLPPVRQPEAAFRREPDLLTHRDDDYLMDGRDDDREPPSGHVPAGPRIPRRKAWRWVRRSIYLLIFLGVTVPIAAFFLIYQNVTVPDPQTVAFGQAQPVTIYYANGTVMDKITTGSRIFLKPNEIPINVRHAVEAAEDETFETNKGFDAKAIARTVRNQLTGGTGGGSTITQEYIKVATGNDEHSLTRKIAEVAEAYKMTKTYPNKNDILAAYLNIVYFGRGAYGIESAARTFYGVDAAHLSPEQAALLAGMIQLPGRANEVDYEHRRFTYVWGRMLADHWISKAQYDAGKFPTPQADDSGGQKALPWDRKLIVNRVLDELAEKDGWSTDALKAQGAQIYTTIQPKAQTAAEHAVQSRLASDKEYTDGGLMFRNGEPLTADGKPVSKDNPQVKATEAAALVSVNPSNGEIIAWFGGNDKKHNQADEANLPHQPGSSFKPYVLLAGLENKPQQIGLQAVYDPKSPQTILGHVVHNSDGDVCPAPCTVKDAMTASINTVFYKMGAQVGTPAVQKAAFQAGIPKKEYYPPAGKPEPSLATLNDKFKPAQIEGGISIGQYPVRPVDQAQGYATIANNGMYIPVHFVRKVTDISGQNVLYQFNTPPKPAFSSDPGQSAALAKTVSDSLTDVAKSSGYALEDDRPANSKTGTQNYVAPDGTDLNYNSDAWTIGFTPQVVTAVWFGHYDKPGPILGDGNNLLHVGSSGGYNVFGREEPGAIWKTFMDTYLKGKPVLQFPTSPADIGGSWDFVHNRDAAQEPPPDTNTQQQQPPNTNTDTNTQDHHPRHTHTPPSNPFHPPSIPNQPTQPTVTVVCPPLPGCGTTGGGGGGGPGGGPPNSPQSGIQPGGG